MLHARLSYVHIKVSTYFLLWLADWLADWLTDRLDVGHGRAADATEATHQEVVVAGAQALVGDEKNNVR